MNKKQQSQVQALNSWIAANPQIMNAYQNVWAQTTATTNTINTYITATNGTAWPTTYLPTYVPNPNYIPKYIPPTLNPPSLGVSKPGFNKYVNGSDLLEEFIAYLGTQGVRKSEFMELPIELFIKWLVIRACEEDQEDPGITLALPAPKTQPRCLGCKRWMKPAPVMLHGPRCASLHFAREAELLALDAAIKAVEEAA